VDSCRLAPRGLSQRAQRRGASLKASLRARYAGLARSPSLKGSGRRGAPSSRG